jgi:hypothetical protein
MATGTSRTVPLPDREGLWLYRGVAWFTALLQTAVIILALVLCFQAQGRPGFWLLLTLVVPSLRYLASPRYRNQVREWLRGHWQQCVCYAAGDGNLPWRAAGVFVVAPTVFLLALSTCLFSTNDSQGVMLTAVSLVREGNWELSEYRDEYRNVPGFTVDSKMPYFLEQTPRGIYSHYPAGMVPFALPVAGLARLTGANLQDSFVRQRLEKWTACGVAAGCLGLFFLLALHLVAPQPAWIMTVMLATGSAMYSTVGQALWQHGGVIFWGLVILLIEFRRARRTGRADAFCQGAACAMMLACRLSSGLFVLAFGAWALVRSPRRAILVALWASVAFVPWAYLYGTIYGHITGPSNAQMAAHHWSLNLREPIFGVLFSPSRGLFVYQPWLVLAGLSVLPGLRGRAMGARAPAGWPIFALTVIGMHLLLISAWDCWGGGHCWGSRLAADVTPLAALFCLRPLAVLWQAVWGRRFVLFLVVLSVLLHVPAVYSRADRWNSLLRPQSTDELWDWSDPPYLYPLLHG